MHRYSIYGSVAISGLTAQVGWLGLSVGCHPALSLHSSNELGELLQWVWSCTIYIGVGITVIIIIMWIQFSCLLHFVVSVCVSVFVQLCINICMINCLGLSRLSSYCL